MIYPVVCLVLLPPSTSPRFPYTTLFRSLLMHQQVRDFLEFGLVGEVEDVVAAIVQVVAGAPDGALSRLRHPRLDRKSTRLNSSHRCISYAVFCLKKKNKSEDPTMPTYKD